MASYNDKLEMLLLVRYSTLNGREKLPMLPLAYSASSSHRNGQTILSDCTLPRERVEGIPVTVVFGGGS